VTAHGVKGDRLYSKIEKIEVPYRNIAMVKRSGDRLCIMVDTGSGIYDAVILYDPRTHQSKTLVKDTEEISNIDANERWLVWESRRKLHVTSLENGRTHDIAMNREYYGAVLNGATAPGGNVTFTGTTELGASVSISVDGGAAIPAVVTGTSWTVALVLLDGPHTATAAATDSAGNTASASVAFELDTGLPAIAFTAPMDGSIVSAAASG
jgi:hypothetical protein